MNVRRSTRRSESREHARAVRAGVLVGVLAVGFTAWVLLSGYSVPFKGYRTVYAEVPNVGALHKHDNVRMAGVRVGQVQSLETTADGRARLKLQIEKSAGALPADSRVIVRAAGLIGARYIEFTRGRSAQALADGATIRAGAASYTDGVPEALDTLDHETRGALHGLINDLGTGLNGNGVGLNDAIHAGNVGLPPFNQIIDSLQQRPQAVARLVSSLDGATAALSDASPDIVAALPRLDRALRPFVDQRNAVQHTLDIAPGALETATRGLASGQRLLRAVRSLSRAAASTLPPAPAALRATTLLLRDSHQPLQRTTRLLRAARPAIPPVLGLTHALSPLTAPLKQTFDKLRPVVETVGKYGCDITNWGVGLRSMTGYGFGGDIPAAPGGTRPTGPLQAFRLGVVLSPTEQLSVHSPDAITRLEPYNAPCQYSAHPATYPTALPTPDARSGR